MEQNGGKNLKSQVEVKDSYEKLKSQIMENDDISLDSTSLIVDFERKIDTLEEEKKNLELLIANTSESNINWQSKYGNLIKFSKDNLENVGFDLNQKKDAKNVSKLEKLEKHMNQIISEKQELKIKLKEQEEIIKKEKNPKSGFSEEEFKEKICDLHEKMNREKILNNEIEKKIILTKERYSEIFEEVSLLEEKLMKKNEVNMIKKSSEN